MMHQNFSKAFQLKISLEVVLRDFKIFLFFTIKNLNYNYKMTTIEDIDNSINILEPIKIDNSIESFQYFDYTPQSQDNLDQYGKVIQIDINASDIYIKPSESYLVITGQLVRADNNNAYGENIEVALVNNAMMYLFSQIKLTVGGKIMEQISNPGQVTSMLAYLTQPDDYNSNAGLKSCWSKDTTNHADSNEFVASVAAPAAGYIAAKIQIIIKDLQLEEVYL